MSTNRYVDVVTYIRGELGRSRARVVEAPGDSPTYDANRAYLGRIRADKKAIANVDAMRRALPKKPPGRS